jgi:ABC-2 type transport system ATP-binding protein
VSDHRGAPIAHRVLLLALATDLEMTRHSVSKTLPSALHLRQLEPHALACAVMHQPPVLFLDEPTSGVAPIVRREFWTHINGLVEHGVTVLVTTHFMDEAEYCDRIALIYRAQQIAMGTADELKASVSSKTGLPDTTLEDAFGALIEESDGQSQAA